MDDGPRQMFCRASDSHGPAEISGYCLLCALKRRERNNRLRDERAADGFCTESRTHGLAVAGRKRCRECLDRDCERTKARQDPFAHKLYKQEHREKLHEAGRCAANASHPRPKKGRKRCDDCLKKQRERSARQIAVNIAAGLCRTAKSHGPSEEGSQLCKLCRATTNKKRNKKRSNG